MTLSIGREDEEKTEQKEGFGCRASLAYIGSRRSYGPKFLDLLIGV